VGDSVSRNLADGLAAVGGASLDVHDGGVDGCGVVEGGPLRYVGGVLDQPAGCDGWRERWAAAVDEVDPDVAFVFAGRWEVMDRVHDGVWTDITDPAYAAVVGADLDDAVAVLSVRGARVVLSTATYYRRKIPPGGGLYPEDEPERVDRYNALVREVAARHPGHVIVADLGGLTGPDGRYVNELDGVVLRRDGVHLTVAGARLLAGWLLPVLLEG
jgi:hypothetical protein